MVHALLEDTIWWRDEADIIITNPPFSLFREFCDGKECSCIRQTDVISRITSLSMSWRQVECGDQPIRVEKAAHAKPWGGDISGT